MKYEVTVSLWMKADSIKEVIDKLITQLIDSPAFRITEVKQLND